MYHKVGDDYKGFRRSFRNYVMFGCVTIGSFMYEINE